MAVVYVTGDLQITRLIFWYIRYAPAYYMHFPTSAASEVSH